MSTRDPTRARARSLLILANHRTAKSLSTVVMASSGRSPLLSSTGDALPVRASNLFVLRVSGFLRRADDLMIPLWKTDSDILELV